MNDFSLQLQNICAHVHANHKHTSRNVTDTGNTKLFKLIYQIHIYFGLEDNIQLMALIEIKNKTSIKNLAILHNICQ